LIPGLSEAACISLVDSKNLKYRKIAERPEKRLRSKGSLNQENSMCLRKTTHGDVGKVGNPPPKVWPMNTNQLGHF